MKHATADTLAALQPLLAQLRTIGRLVERTPGCFYLKSSAFLHFHEDATGIFADVKFDPASFSRVRVTSAVEQARLVQDVRRCLGDANARRPG